MKVELHPPGDILHFWFVEHGPDDWFSGAADFDAALPGASPILTPASPPARPSPGAPRPTAGWRR
jgi:hypothetical protein